MKKNEKKDIFSRSLTELRKSIRDSKKELFQLILDNTQFKLKDNRQIFHKRKEIARILTVIKEKEMAQEAEQIKK